MLSIRSRNYQKSKLWTMIAVVTRPQRGTTIQETHTLVSYMNVTRTAAFSVKAVWHIANAHAQIRRPIYTVDGALWRPGCLAVLCARAQRSVINTTVYRKSRTQSQVYQLPINDTGTTVDRVMPWSKQALLIHILPVSWNWLNLSGIFVSHGQPIISTSSIERC